MEPTDWLYIAALNYPLSKGTALAFPMAAFGLSAFLFSTVGAFALRDDTAKLLLLLASSTTLFPILSFPFLSVHPQPRYDQLPTRDSHDRFDSQPLHRTSSTDSRKRPFSADTGAQSTASTPFLSDADKGSKDLSEDDKPYMSSQESHETSSLMSNPSASGSGNQSPYKSIDLPDSNPDGPHLDIRGFALLPHPEFWQLFLLVGLLTGIGIMTIK